MSKSAHSLSALLGSRICHDLISPIGAIGNGVELLSMSGSGGPEVDLIAASAGNANARIRFFRIAYGLATVEQRVGQNEIVSVLRDVYEPTRLTVDWMASGDCSRAETRLVFLLLQCLESALPLGGRIHITQTDKVWRLQAEAEKTKVDPDLWNRLSDASVDLSTLTASQVQFALAPMAAQDLDRTLNVEMGDMRLAVTF